MNSLSKVKLKRDKKKFIFVNQGNLGKCTSYMPTLIKKYYISIVLIMFMCTLYFINNLFSWNFCNTFRYARSRFVYNSVG